MRSAHRRRTPCQATKVSKPMLASPFWTRRSARGRTTNATQSGFISDTSLDNRGRNSDRASATKSYRELHHRGLRGRRDYEVVLYKSNALSRRTDGANSLIDWDPALAQGLARGRRVRLDHRRVRRVWQKERLPWRPSRPESRPPTDTSEPWRRPARYGHRC
jgi:hypothetical protein